MKASMNRSKCGALMLALLLSLPAAAEPLVTVLGFERGAYSDKASSEIVVRISRLDQDPASESEQFSVDCALTGGTAVDGVDYRLVFNGSVQGLGKVVFPAGVREQAFSVQALGSAGGPKTLLIGISNPTGPAPVVTGENPVAEITINAPR